MEDKEIELAKYYERRVRNGFPSGEVKSELLKKGYSEEEAITIISQINKISQEKSSERHKDFRFFIGGAFIIGGILMLASSKQTIGIWLIISGILKIVYDVFSPTKGNT